jgi:ectoine hydroxylase-related dioxygenase (phytanoyl-CoA dioxygenase family)
MLTLRIHLDAMTADNGPLSVVPGSHFSAGDEQTPPIEIHAAAGDVLAMRPLLTHSSSLPRPGAGSRRVIHLELAPSEELPDGYAWHAFHRVTVC